MSEDKGFNIKSSTIEKGLDLAKDFLGKLIFPSVEEMGLLMADNVRIWRFKNQIKLLEKTQSYVEDKGIVVKKIPLKTLVPLLEESSLEEDIELQEKWAALLVNYIDSSKNLKSSVFPFVLGQISTSEAKAIDRIAAEGGEISYSELKKTCTIDFGELSNLVRLGILLEKTEIMSFRGDYDEDGNWLQDICAEHTDEYSITTFGYEFIDACRVDG